jgi:hypothetical protein
MFITYTEAPSHQNYSGTNEARCCSTAVVLTREGGQGLMRPYPGLASAVMYAHQHQSTNALDVFGPFHLYDWRMCHATRAHPYHSLNCLPSVTLMSYAIPQLTGPLHTFAGQSLLSILDGFSATRLTRHREPVPHFRDPQLFMIRPGPKPGFAIAIARILQTRAPSSKERFPCCFHRTFPL